MLKSEFKSPVLYLTLNRPDVRNAFNDELIGALGDAFRSLPVGTRAVVLGGEGPAFCAGGDLDWMRRAASYTAEQNVADALKLARLFDAIRTCPAIVVSRVHGAAFGGGCGLVAAADIAVASDDTKFAFSEVRLGLIPATIAPFVLDKIGAGHARALFTTGEAFGAERALRIGLVHEVCASAQLEDAVNAKLNAILAAGPKAVLDARSLVLDKVDSPEDTARRLASVRSSEEGREGVSAFLEKRKANWVEKVL